MTPPPSVLGGGVAAVWEKIEPKLRDIARRAGMADVPPAVVVAACALCVLACAWALWRWWPRETPAERFEPGEVQSAVADGSQGPSRTESAPVAEARVFVHVVGAVRRPGVYELPISARVADAVEAAGGMLPDAVASGVNLARPVADGEQIVVPDEDDPVVASGGAGGASGTGAQGVAAGGPVDINSADAALLDTLPGIGPTTAAKIVADREANGPFASVEDLGRVSGIGPKKLEELAGVVCVR